MFQCKRPFLDFYINQIVSGYQKSFAMSPKTSKDCQEIQLHLKLLFCNVRDPLWNSSFIIVLRNQASFPISPRSLETCEMSTDCQEIELNLNCNFLKLQTLRGPLNSKNVCRLPKILSNSSLNAINVGV